MPVRAIGEYDFPALDAKENFGDDQIVHVLWRGNPFFSAAGAFRAPSAIPFEAFLSDIVEPWLKCDPDYDPAAPKSWTVDDTPVDPAGKTLAETGVEHKGLLTFTTA